MICKNCKHWVKKICEVKKLKTGANYGCEREDCAITVLSDKQIETLKMKFEMRKNAKRVANYN